MPFWWQNVIEFLKFIEEKQEVYQWTNDKRSDRNALGNNKKVVSRRCLKYSWGSSTYSQTKDTH